MLDFSTFTVRPQGPSPSTGVDRLISLPAFHDLAPTDRKAALLAYHQERFEDEGFDRLTPHAKSKLREDFLEQYKDAWTPRKDETGYDVWGGVKTMGRGLTWRPGSVAARAADVLQGQSGVDVADPDFLDRFVAGQDAKEQEFIQDTARKYKEKKIFPGISVRDVAEAAPSLGFSGASSLAGLGAGAAAHLAVPAPGPGTAAAYGAGMAASGATAYRMASAQIMRQYLTVKNQESLESRGRGLTPDEEAGLKRDFAARAREYGLWEAIPEAVGGAGGFAILTAPLKKMLGKGLATKVLSKLAGVYGEELVTETITQMGQNKALAGTPIGPAQAPEWTSLRDWGQAFIDVAPQTVLVTSLIAGGTGAGVSAWRRTVEPRLRAGQIKAVVREGLLSQAPAEAVSAMAQEAEELSARFPKDGDLAAAVDVLRGIQNSRPGAETAGASEEQIPSVPDFLQEEETEPVAVAPPAPTAPTQPMGLSGADTTRAAAHPVETVPGAITGAVQDAMEKALEPPDDFATAISPGQAASLRGIVNNLGSVEEVDRVFPGSDSMAVIARRLARKLWPEEEKHPPAGRPMPAGEAPAPAESVLDFTEQGGILQQGAPFPDADQAAPPAWANILMGKKPEGPPASPEGGPRTAPARTVPSGEASPAEATAIPKWAEMLTGKKPSGKAAKPAETPSSSPHPALSQGERVQPPVEPRAVGSAAKAFTPDQEPVGLQYALVDAGDVTASNHHETLAPNPDYPQELQPRNRERGAMRLQVAQMAQKIQPEMLGESANVTTGAPIVGQDLVVESGNGRVLALRKAYADGTAENYKAWLAENAERFGLSRKDVDALAAPVLVRVRTSEVKDRAEFTRQANARDAAGMSPAEEARADAAILDGEVLDLFAPNEEGQVVNPGNMPFVRAFLSSLPKSEASTLTTEDGKPNKRLADRLTAALFFKAYGDQDLTALQAEETNPDIKAVLNALINAAGKFAKLRTLTDAPEVLEIGPKIAQAAKLIRFSRRERAKLADILKQRGLFGDIDPDVEKLATFFDKNLRSSKSMIRFMNILADGMRGFIEDQDQTKLFEQDDAWHKAGTLIESAVRRAENERAQNEQAELFGDVPGADIPGDQAPGKSRGRRAPGEAGGVGTGPRSGAAGEAPQEVTPAEQPPAPEEDAVLEEPAAKPAASPGLEAEARALDLDGFDAMFDQAVREVKAEQAAAPAGQPAKTPAPVATSAAKEPWQMTPDEYVGNRTDKDEVAVARAAHPQHVKRALDEGKPVPGEVLAKYRHNGWAQKELNRRAEGVSDAEFFWRGKLTGSGRYDAAKAAGYSDEVAGRLSKTLWHYLSPEQKSRLAPPILAMYGQGESPQGVLKQAPAAGKTLADFGLKVSRTVTIAGKPVWEVTGNTREHKDALKALGARWYGPRKAWSFNSDPTERILAKLSGAAENAASAGETALAQPAPEARPQRPVDTPASGTQNENAGAQPAPGAEPVLSGADIIKKAAKEGVTGIDEAVKALHELFGGGRGLRGGLIPLGGLDEEAYRKARPHFVASFNAFKASGKSLMDFMKFCVQSFGEAIRPYLKHFMKEVQAGTYEQPYQAKGEEAGNGDADNAGGGSPREAAAGDDRAGDEGTGPEDAPGADRVGETPGLPPGPGAAVDGGVPGRGEQDSNRPGQQARLEKGPAEVRPGSRNADKAGLGGNAGNVPGLRGADYVIPPGGLARTGGWKTAARNNLDAIELFKKIAAENRPATPEEQAILSQYVGWGATELANNLFPGYALNRRVIENYAKHGWGPLVERMLALLTPEEIATAARSTQYAHYTSEPIVRSIYQALSRMGFTGGKILEPGSGVGNFIGMMPEAMRKNSAYTAVEMDHVTAGIAKLLYPNQNVQQADFVKLTLPQNFFDAAIGNPPFGKTTILADPEYRKNRFSLHNFFFAKALDRVRPGGLLVFVTSRYTMDSQADQARAYMAERADLLGAIRLPQSAFKESAGTEVVTDVLFLQKREPGAMPSGQAWTGQKTIQVGDQSVPVNEYFADHPEMVLGRHSLEGSMYGENEYTVMPMEGDIAEHFAAAAMKLPEKVYQKARKTTKKAHALPAVIERDWNPKNQKEGGVYLSDSGAVMITDFGSGVPVESRHKLSPADRALLADYIPLRNALKRSHQAQWEGKDWEQALEALNREYDRFVKKHGRIQEFTTRTKTVENEDGEPQTIEYRILKNERVLKIDTEWSLVLTLEEVKPDGTIVKAAPLLGRTIKVPTTPEIKSVPDALAVSLDRTGALDLDDVAELSGKPREEVVAALGDLIYEDPGGGGHLLADEYLSGNVVKKLDEALAAAKVDARYQRNVEALEKNQPEPLAPKDIVVTMGAPWVPVGYYGTFASEVLGMPLTEVTRHQADNSWTVLPVSSRKGKTYSPQGLRGAGNEWGTPDRGPNELLDAILNNRQIRITRTERVAGSTKTFLDKEATAAANEKAKRIREKFASWVWSDSSRAAELLSIYNTKVNVINGRKFDGSHLTMPGMSQHFRPYDHQKRGIWRILQTGNAYLAHAVGAGKTATMIAAGMEMRRLGLVQKPLYVVPNHMLGQFAQEFQELYPMASILVADEQNFHTDNRRRFVAQATMNNPDAIILTHSAFGLLRVKEETLAPVRKKFLESMQAALEEMRDDEDSARMRIKRMEQRIEQAEQRFDSMISGGDNVVTFEELGADFLFVDEAHMFRKLDFTTNQQIKGIDPNGSKRALDLYIKTLWLEHMNPGRSHVFASGTPITNTLAELYTLQRFFGAEQLDEDDVDHFDAWSAMYGQAATDYEMNASGMYEPVTRFARFVNIPELMSRVRMFMDVLTGSQLGTRVTRPAVRGGTPELVIAPKNEALKTYQEKVLQPRIKKSRAWKPSKAQPGNPDPLINIITDGKLASIDMRFVVSIAKNDPGSKLNQFIDGIIAAYEDTRDNTYMTEYGGDTPSPVKGGAQICFYNVGFGDAVARNRGFDARAWLMGRLKKAGIPESQVAWIDDYNDAAKKQALFKEVRDGRKRILIGSAKKMGTGVNAQNRLTHLHYLDPPWFPADVEQPDGRIIRQGNQNREVVVKRYATKGSYDATMWQMVARKSRFIEQAFLGDASVRSLDDVSESSQYEMASALASGDERVIELARLRADVERLHMLEGAHHQEQAKLASEKSSLGWDIERLEKRIADLAYLDEHNPGYIVGEKFQGEVDGKKFGKRRDFGQAMMDRAMAAGARLDFKEDSRPSAALGKINGFDVSATFARSQREGVAWFISGMRLSRDGHASGFDAGQPDAKGMKAGEVDPQGFATRIVNAVNSLSAELSRARHELSEAQKKLERTKKKIGAPFEFANEMAGKVAEAARLEQELAAEGEAARKEEQNAKQGKAGKSPAAQPEQPAAPAPEAQYSTVSRHEPGWVLSAKEAEEKPPVPVIELSGEEIAPAGTPFQEMRARAREHARKNAQGMSIVNRDTGYEIGIGGNGLKEAANQARSIQDLQAFAAIPALLENGMLQRVETDSRGRASISAVERYYAPIRIAGDLYRARLTVRRTKEDGRKYYTHHVEDITIEAVEESSPRVGLAPRTNDHLSTASEIKVRDLLRNVKGSAFSTRAAREARKPAAAGVTAAMVREAYPASQGWEADLTPEGHLHFRHAATGEEVTVELVSEITPDAMSFAVSRGRAPRHGEGIAGSFRRGRITLSLLADQWTVRHEQYHEFVDAGIVTRADQDTLQKAIVRRIQTGTLPFQSASVEGEVEPGGEEDQARYVEEMLKTRAWDREQGGVRAVLQKIADFVDGLVNLFHRTARGVVREVESGAIANRYRAREAAIRGTEPKVKNAAGADFSPEQYSTPAPVMGPAVTRDLEANRTFANRIFEQRDVGRHFAQVETQKLQKRVQALAGGKSKRRVAMPWTYDRENKRSTDSDLLDMAMMLWRDTGGDEQKLSEYRTWANAQLARPDTAPKNRLRYKEHVAVVNRALALSPEEKALVDEIGGRYDQAFTVANANKVVQTHRDNYARRLWALPKKPGAELRGGSGAYGFKVTTTAAKERTLETILDGWKAGYDLAVKGLTGSYGEYMQELETVLANKDFVAQGYNTR
ncbi:MAG: DEAD/DEAH box helicase family protein, partial [Thermodesulfobacteriota bacterium]